MISTGLNLIGLYIPNIESTPIDIQKAPSNFILPFSKYILSKRSLGALLVKNNAIDPTIKVTKLIE